MAIVYTLPGPLTSSIVKLTVLPDTFPPVPSAAAITKSDGAIQVGVGFDEPVNQADLVHFFADRRNFTVRLEQLLWRLQRDSL
jgi:hypothetical protein